VDGHAEDCVVWWRWVVIGCILSFGWMSLATIGALVLPIGLLAAWLSRAEFVSPGGLGVISGFGLPVLWYASKAPSHRAAGWYAAGASFVVVGALAFAAWRHLRAR
jgi:hypothetical protein